MNEARWNVVLECSAARCSNEAGTMVSRARLFEEDCLRSMAISLRGLPGTLIITKSLLKPIQEGAAKKLPL
jgi:hypothetical protein